MSRAALLRYPLLALLQPAELDAWFVLGRELTFAAGETVLQEGTDGVCVYLVREGRIRVLRSARNGREVSLGQAGPGDLFGEYALLQPGGNVATCRAACPARLLRLPLRPLRALLASLPTVEASLKRWLRLHALLGYLRGGSFLGFMSADSSLALLEHFRPVSFAAEQTVQADGLGADRWYVIESGQARLQPEGGGPRVLGPGDAFGERALLGWQGLPTVESLTPLHCQYLPRDAFAPLNEDSSSIQTFATPQRAWFGQQEEADCGVAALAMAARARGLAVTPDGVRPHVRLGPHGASLADLQGAAAALGLHAQAAHVAPEHLGEVDLPAVAHLASGHYVALYRHGDTGVLVGDPATGVVTWSAALFREAYSGHLLLLGQSHSTLRQHPEGAPPLSISGR
jgi:CRP-like cAMP-binding protein